MKTIIKFLIIAVFTFGIYNCNEENTPVATSTSSSSTTSSCCIFATLTGVGSLPTGVVGEIQNTRVALFTSIENWNLDNPIALTACDGSGNYNTGGLLFGLYYMDAWKDNDNDGIWGSPGDYIWVYGSEVWPNTTLDTIQIVTVQKTVNFELFVVP